MLVGIVVGSIVGIIAGLLSPNWIVLSLAAVFVAAVSFFSYRMYAARKVSELGENIADIAEMSIDRETFENFNQMGDDVLKIEERIEKMSSMKHQLIFMFILPLFATLISGFAVYAIRMFLTKKA